MDTGHKIDTLSAADRLAFRTNAVEWLILVPNIGIEYDLGRYNYNRYSIGLNLRYNWQTSHTFKTGVIFNVAEARLELRNYYRIREFSNYVERKKGFVDRLLSPRTWSVRKALWTVCCPRAVKFRSTPLPLSTVVCLQPIISLPRSWARKVIKAMPLSAV